MYRLTVRVTHSIGSGRPVVGEASIEISTMVRPTMGSFTVTPATGIELSTTFTLRSIGWMVPVDGHDPMKISQRFAYKTPSGRLVPLSDFSSTPSIEVTLPRGAGEENGLELLCIIQASAGSRVSTLNELLSTQHKPTSNT